LKNENITPADYAKVAVIAREASMTLLARLDLMTLKPSHILDIGSNAIFSTTALKERYPAAFITAIDPVETNLKYAKQMALPASGVCADAANLPIVDQGFDLIIANLFIPWCADIKKLLREWRRVLRPEGLLMLTTLGPDTLQELQPLKELWPHLVDMHDLGDELVRAGFADPVLDVLHITLKYRKWEQLWQELYITKMVNTASFTSEASEQMPLPLTYEIIFSHAWGPANMAHAADEEGIVRIPLSHLRKR
jgi:malonyl-CoA O-methyltransferase